MAAPSPGWPPAISTKEETPRPAPFAVPFGLRGARLEMRDVRLLQRRLEQRRKVAAVVSRADRGLVRHPLGRDQVASAQRQPVDPTDPGRGVDKAFEAVIRLGSAGAAIGPGRHGVGEQQSEAQSDLRDVVHARQAAREIGGRDEGAVRGQVGAHIGEHVDVEGEKPPALVERQLGFDDRVARLIVAQKPFRASREPMHRAAELFCRNQQRRVFGVPRGAHAKGAADIAAQHPNTVWRDAETLRQMLTQHDSALRGAMQQEAVAIAVIRGERAAQLNRRHDETLIDQPHSCDMRRRSENAVGLLALLLARCEAAPV
jgi:hypothetical protein